jgi:hypothetical protein
LGKSTLSFLLGCWQMIFLFLSPGRLGHRKINRYWDSGK